MHQVWWAASYFIVRKCRDIECKGNKSHLHPDSRKGLRAMDKQITIYATLMAKVKGVDARIMLDSVAESSYICTSLIRGLGIRPFKTERRVIEQTYGTVVKQVQLYRVELAPNTVEKFSIELKCSSGEKEVLMYLANPCIGELKRKYRRFRRLQFSDEESTENYLGCPSLIVHQNCGTC